MFSTGLKRLTQALVAAAFALGTSTVLAEDGPFFGQKAAGKWIIGAKVSNIDPNVDQIKDSRGVGIVLGYEFDKEIAGGKSSFELEYISGDEERINVDSGATYEASVINAYFTYRSPGDLYYKIKGGLSYVDIDVRTELFADLDFEDTSLAAGIGLGYRFNDFGMVEIEYTQDSGDSDLGILSLHGLLNF